MFGSLILTPKLEVVMEIIKKDGTTEKYNPEKIIKAVSKSSERVNINLTKEEYDNVCNYVESNLNELGIEQISVNKIHNYVELALSKVNEDVAKSYRDYRNYKQDFVHIMDDVLKESQSIRYIRR